MVPEFSWGGSEETHENPEIYVVGSKIFRRDIQKPLQLENAVRGYIVPSMVRLMYQLEKCVEIKGDYVEK
jgi:hypothetical protein